MSVAVKSLKILDFGVPNYEKMRFPLLMLFSHVDDGIIFISIIIN